MSATGQREDRVVDADAVASVLLVDDQPARLLSYETILSGLGLEFVRASSGTEALQRMMEREFALVLLDVSMPDMDGFETAELIHQHPRFERTPIIFVTGVHVTELDRMRGYQLGAVDYVYVPVVPAILRGKVSVLVELYSKRRELQCLNRSLAEANAKLAQANETLRTEKINEVMELNRTLAAANARLAEVNVTLERENLERARAEEALRRERARYQTLVQATAQIVWTAEADGHILRDSPSWRAFTGQTYEQWIGRGWLDAIHPEDRERAQGEWDHAIAHTAKVETEYRIRHRDGGYRIAEVRAIPILEPDGTVSEWVGMNIDVTEARQAAEHRELLLGELSHRVKNTLAVVQSIATNTQRTVETPEQFHDVFAGRLQALARVHDLLTRERWDGTWLADLVREALLPYRGANEEGRIAIEGPRVRLMPMSAMSLSLAFHELATNAAKYGALSSGAGRVVIDWRHEIPEGPDEPAIALTWTEQDGPPVVAPKRRGFGSRLIERNIPIELGGKAQLEFAPTGLRCRFWLPLSSKITLDLRPGGARAQADGVGEAEAAAGGGGVTASARAVSSRRVLD